MMSYEQLNEAERKVIKIKLREGKSLREIVRLLSRIPSTITRELDQNRGSFWYNRHEAQKKAKNMEKNAKKGLIDTDSELKEYILNEL